ncbi:hypothetical protein ACQ86N_06095 [Puia sp. P3]|uniref:hypothetical protein n=1 Tax=Puia sp. P3 TaxID=3423952 RepID=UPI003D66A620
MSTIGRSSIISKSLILDRFDRMTITPGLLKTAGDILGIQATTADQLRTGIVSVNYLNRQLFDGLAPLFDLDFENFRKEQKPFMDKAQIRRLIAQGFSVGAHSIDHPLYSLVPLAEQLETDQGIHGLGTGSSSPQNTGLSHSPTWTQA